MSRKGFELTQEIVSQTIDLNDVVGSDISEDEVLVNRIGQAIIDFMDERSMQGKGYNGQNLKAPYSDAYADSLNFKAAGKSKNQVTMRLSGDMMASIDILKVDGSKLVIGIDDPDQAPKAYNHQTGDTVPKREFFGVSTEELKKKILPEFKKEIQAKKVTSAEELNKMVSFIRGIKTLGDLLK